MEIFRDIPGYDRYVASSYGKIYIKKDMKIKIPGNNGRGYQTIGLCHKGINKVFALHRVIAKIFIPNDNSEKQIINHKDGNKENNNIENLEWCTQSENCLHSYRVLGREGGFKKPHTPYREGKNGSNHCRSKIVQQFTKDGKHIKDWDSIREGAKSIGVKDSNITHCLSGRNKTSGGFIRKLKDQAKRIVK